MNRFPTIREAKEHLIGRILAQADQDGISLSNVEREMLYFSGTGWTLSNMMAISQDFVAVTTKMNTTPRLAESFDACAIMARETKTMAVGSEAVKRLRAEDHYLLVLIDGARKVAANRPSGDIGRLIVAAALVSAVFVGSAFFVFAHVTNAAVAKTILIGVLFAVGGATVFLFNRR